ncbi:MAG TPA: NlpC/P60 family protein [Actinomycetes bacterium]|nr:NlpC/P60 family protein [Actinomycetes bacterium]
MATRRLRCLRHPRHVALSVTAATTSLVVAGALLAGTASADPKPTVAQVEARVAALNVEVEQAAELYNESRDELDTVTKALAKLKERLAATEAKLADAQLSVDAFASATYRSAGVDPTVQLLMSENPDAFLRRASSLNEVSRQQAQALQAMTTVRTRMAQDKLAVAQQLGLQQEAEATLKAAQKRAEAKLAEAERLLRSLKAEDRARIEARRAAERQEALAQARAAAAAERAAHRTTRSTKRSAPTTTKVAASGRAAAAVKFAYAQLGDRYSWGAAGMSRWDCSGLTMMAYRAAGVSLPHSSRGQAGTVRSIPRSQLKPGDLVFFYSPISHVGIYIGGGKMIDAPHPGASVRITSISSMPFVRAGRI